MRYYRHLEAEIKSGEIARVYVFHGEEVYLQQKAVELLCDVLLEPATASFNYDSFDGDTADLTAVVGAAETPPVFSQWRLVVVKNAPSIGEGVGGRRGEDAAGVDALAHYAQNPCPTTCLVLVRPGQLDKRKRLTKVLLQQARVINFASLSPEDIQRWLARRARDAGKEFTGAAVRLLAGSASTAGLTGLEQECAKLFCYVGERESITEDDVRNLVPPSVEETVFAVVDAIGEKRAGKAVQGIRTLLQARESPFAVLALLARQLRMILAVDELARDG
ncbi:MAG: DNA polymerase III subunit delta, partial [Bacillota bacterium]